MLHFSRLKTVAILLTVFVLCGFAVPNFFSEETTRNWPSWAQGRLVLGGTSVLLEVDRSDIRAQLLKSLRYEVRSALENAGIGWANAPRVRGDAVEVRLGEGNFHMGLAKLRDPSEPLGGARPFDVADAGGGIVRLTPTEAAVTERARRAIDGSIPELERRFSGLGVVKANVQRQGSDRILVQKPGYGPFQMLEY
jgi:preprotein translocase subunit SecD